MTTPTKNQPLAPAGIATAVRVLAELELKGDHLSEAPPSKMHEQREWSVRVAKGRMVGADRGRV